MALIVDWLARNRDGILCNVMVGVALLMPGILQSAPDGVSKAAQLALCFGGFWLGAHWLMRVGERRADRRLADQMVADELQRMEDVKRAETVAHLRALLGEIDFNCRLSPRDITSIQQSHCFTLTARLDIDPTLGTRELRDALYGLQLAVDRWLAAYGEGRATEDTVAEYRAAADFAQICVDRALRALGAND